MARLIVKSPYIKCGGGQGADGYMRYIATRERVEIIPDDRPPTRKQEQLITKLTKDFPDVKELLEYEDYVQKPTKANASSLITLALEEHWKQVRQMDGYMKYIATRPRAERLGDHGLFGDADHVDLDAAMSELEHYTGNVWTHILSLHREDAERLGYNNAQAWRALLRAHRNDIAATMHIPPQDFRWYAAFHNEGHHPHVHMMAWSVKQRQAHLDRGGIRQMKSQLTNDIFQQELLHVYEQKSASRDELVKETRKVMLELSRQMRETVCEHTQAEQMIWKLSRQLGEVKGKKSYGYLPRPMKRQVDEIVDQLEQIPVVNECYQKWWELQCQVNAFYSGKKQQRPPLSKQKEFRAIRNAVIRETENIRLGKITFEDEKREERGEWVENWEVSYDCLRLRARIEDNKLSLDQRDEVVEDLERLAEYLNYFNNHIIPELGDIKLDKLTTIQIQKFYNDLQKNGRVQRYQHIQLKNKGLSVRVVHGIHTLLNNCLEQAVAERLILVNPARGCKLPKMEKREMKVLPEEKIRPYLMEADKRGLLAPFYLELTTGLRRGELLALLWKDLDVENRTISITKQVTRTKGELVVSQPKTHNSIRVLPVSQQAVELLVEEHKKHPGNPYMFPSPKTGGMFDPDSFRHTHEKILKAIGAEHIRFHDLRHTFATLSLKNGVDVKTLSNTLGHYSAGFTLSTYTHATPDMMREAADTMGDVIGKVM